MGLFSSKVRESQTRSSAQLVRLAAVGVVALAFVFAVVGGCGGGDAESGSASPQVTAASAQARVTTTETEWPGTVSGHPSDSVPVPERPLDAALPGGSLSSIPKGVEASVSDPNVGAAVLDEIAAEARSYGKGPVASYLEEIAAKWREKGY